MSRYRGLFLSEASDHVRRAFELARSLDAHAAPGEALQDLLRHTHSLKGMAATMGLTVMVDVAHALEDLLEAAVERHPAPSFREDAAEALACLERMIESVERGGDADDAEAPAIIRRLRAPGDERGAGAPPVADGRDTSPTAPAGPRPWRVEIELAARLPLPSATAAMLLGRLEALGPVSCVTPPMSTLRTGRFAGAFALTLASDRTADELESSLLELPEVAGATVATVEADPQASAGPAAAAPVPSWVRVRSDLLDGLLEHVLELMLERRRLAGSLDPCPAEATAHLDRLRALLRRTYGTLMELRLLPLSSIADRLARGVETLAGELGKQVDLRIEGSDVRLDRSLLETLVDPLLHLLRNALDHGIEPPAERLEAGKPARGTVWLRFERQADAVGIVVEDDGRGLSAERLRRVAVERGKLSAAEAARLDDDEAYALALLPGLSTAAAVSRVSGRGVGMDVVRHAVGAIGGRLRIDSRRGGGAAVKISLPLRLAVLDGLLVRCHGELYAVPLSAVETTIDLSAAEVQDGAGVPWLRVQGARVELIRLADRLGLAPGDGPPVTRPWALLLARSVRGVGLVVDEVLGRRELVVRPLEAPLRALPEYSGAALLEDGSIVLVLDTPRAARAS